MFLERVLMDCVKTIDRNYGRVDVERLVCVHGPDNNINKISYYLESVMVICVKIVDRSYGCVHVARLVCLHCAGILVDRTLK
jgi:hypothetical protein